MGMKEGGGGEMVLRGVKGNGDRGEFCVLRNGGERMSYGWPGGGKGRGRGGEGRGRGEGIATEGKRSKIRDEGPR